MAVFELCWSEDKYAHEIKFIYLYLVTFYANKELNECMPKVDLVRNSTACGEFKFYI